jgi:hypothetical protein
MLGEFFGIDHILGHKTNLNKFKEVEIIYNCLLHNDIKIGSNHRSNLGKFKNRKLNNMIKEDF